MGERRIPLEGLVAPRLIAIFVERIVILVATAA